MKGDPPMYIPAAKAYEAWSRRQSYCTLQWERLSGEQMMAWRDVVEAVMMWIEEEMGLA